MAKLISYDLSKPGRDYSDLYKAIKKLGGWWHHLESDWITTSSLSCADIRDQLTPYLDANDKIAVFGLSGGWATKGISKKGNQWLSDHL